MAFAQCGTGCGSYSTSSDADAGLASASAAAVTSPVERLPGCMINNTARRALYTRHPGIKCSSLNIHRINILRADDDALMHASQPCDVMILTSDGSIRLRACVDETGNRFVHRGRQLALFDTTLNSLVQIKI